MLWWSSAPPTPPFSSLATLWWSSAPPAPPWSRSGGLLIHHGGCQLCFGDLQFHSGSMLHWLCFSPLSPHEQGLPTLHGLAYHPAPVPPSLHYSPVLFHGERLEAAPWGGAMSQLVSWLATRGRQTHTHHMDFILKSISHHAH